MKYLPPVVFEGDDSVEGRVVMAVDPRVAALIHRLFGWFYGSDPLTWDMYKATEKQLPEIARLRHFLDAGRFTDEVLHKGEIPRFEKILVDTEWELE